MVQNKLTAVGIVSFLSLLGLLIIGCNKDPYMPEGPATYMGQADNKYGLDNDGQAALQSLRVMTYNIHGCVPPSKPDTVDIGGIIAAIKSGNPDIVFMQEVDKGTNRNGFTHDQAKVIADELKMNFIFFSAREYLRGFYGVAMLSKYPLLTARKYLLTRENESTEQRVMGTAYVDLPGKDSVLGAVTHLQHNSATNRIQQINDIVGILGSKTDRIILGGDFNELESANTQFFSILDATFTRDCKGPNCIKTFPASNPTSTIDYVVFRPAAAFSVTGHNTLQSQASDHLPVINELKFNR